MSTNDQADVPAADKKTSESIDTKLVRKLADILKDTDLTEIEVERGGLRIRVARGGVAVAAPAVAPVTYQPAPAAVGAAPAAAAPTASARGDAVKSPMVGTVYLAPQPGQPPFVKVGDRVAEGQTLLIVEAMKTMNPIPSPKAGTVVEILVEDGQPVEFGEGLVVLE